MGPLWSLDEDIGLLLRLICRHFLGFARFRVIWFNSILDHLHFQLRWD